MSMYNKKKTGFGWERRKEHFISDQFFVTSKLVLDKFTTADLRGFYRPGPPTMVGGLSKDSIPEGLLVHALRSLHVRIFFVDARNIKSAIVRTSDRRNNKPPPQPAECNNVPRSAWFATQDPFRGQGIWRYSEDP
mmetsp:Transcript_6711/g.23421  ORF Transcript_6711/g.23421 Transcript_6711/m.23421 type:complete len:135 (+) Transcript_6711:114-518(+)